MTLGLHVAHVHLTVVLSFSFEYFNRRDPLTYPLSGEERASLAAAGGCCPLPSQLDGRLEGVAAGPVTLPSARRWNLPPPETTCPLHRAAYTSQPSHRDKYPRLTYRWRDTYRTGFAGGGVPYQSSTSSRGE